MEKGSYFMVEYKGNDKSWRNNTFRCIASDDRVVVGMMCGKESNIFKDPLTFARSEWEFYPASMDVVEAQCFDPMSKIDQLECELNAAREFGRVADREVASLIDRCGRYRKTCDASIIVMYWALVAAGMSLSLLVFAL